MPHSLAEQIHGSLSASRDEVERIIADAEERARAVNARAAGRERALVAARLARIAELRSELERNGQRIDAGYARLAEAMAAASARLAEAARDADITPPPWPDRTERTVEVRLAETRAVTLRYTSGTPGSAGGASGSRISGR